jgi:RHS repeat-associated protein
VLQLTNLHGDVIATAYLSETATALASTADTSEFGVPTASLPPKYSWLGADEIPTELPSGILDMGARSYEPQLGRFMQPDPVPGGSANAYTYTFGDPVNTTDPSGALTYGFSAWLREANAQQDQEVVAREVARETLEREEAERRAAEAKAAAEAAIAPPEGEPGPLGGSASWACQYSAETGQEDPECGGEGGGGEFGGGGTMAITASEGSRNKGGGEGETPTSGGYECRSGGKKVNGKCQPGSGTVGNNCGYVGAGALGTLGSLGGPYVALIAGAIGAKAGEALCGSGKT